MSFSLKFAAIACFALSTVHLFAQNTTASTPANNRWGLRSDLVLTGTYSRLNIALGGTYLLHRQHQFSVVALLNPYVFNNSYNYTSPFLGSSVSYQYFLLKQRRILHPYAYFAAAFQNFSRSTNDGLFLYQAGNTWAHGKRVGRFRSGTAMVGLGLEARFRRHLYGNFSAGIGIRSQNMRLTYRFTESSSQTSPATEYFKGTDLNMEIKLGVGYRF